METTWGALLRIQVFVRRQSPPAAIAILLRRQRGGGNRENPSAPAPKLDKPAPQRNRLIRLLGCGNFEVSTFCKSYSPSGLLAVVPRASAACEKAKRRWRRKKRAARSSGTRPRKPVTRTAAASGRRA